MTCFLSFASRQQRQKVFWTRWVGLCDNARGASCDQLFYYYIIVISVTSRDVQCTEEEIIEASATPGPQQGASRSHVQLSFAWATSCRLTASTRPKSGPELFPLSPMRPVVCQEVSSSFVYRTQATDLHCCVSHIAVENKLKIPQMNRTL